MSTLTIKLLKPHSGQRHIINSDSRFRVAVMGRRWGKTTVGGNIVIGAALQGKPAAWFAPSYKLLNDVWRDIKGRLQPVTVNRSEQEKRLELVTGGVIEFWSLDNPDAGRGRKYAQVVIDEAAMVRRLDEAWQGAIRPTLTDYAGGALFISTPKGLNYFRTLYGQGVDGRNGWHSWQMPTSANPYIPAGEIEAARLELPERVFRQEYLAEFLDDANLFRGVKECATGRRLSQPEPGREYVMGVDWGKLNDFTVLTVWDTKALEMVHLDRFNQIDYNVQAGRLEALARRFNVADILAESNSMGEPMIDALRARGLPIRGFQTTNASKAQIINQLSLAFEQRSVKILDDDTLIAELGSYEAERLPGGTLRYSAPPGLHDDTVMSCAIGLDAAINGGRSLLLW